MYILNEIWASNLALALQIILIHNDEFLPFDLPSINTQSIRVMMTLTEAKNNFRLKTRRKKEDVVATTKLSIGTDQKHASLLCPKTRAEASQIASPIILPGSFHATQFSHTLDSLSVSHQVSERLIAAQLIPGAESRVHESFPVHN